MDVVWVVGSAIIVSIPPFDITGAGRWLVVVVAAVVGMFAVLQFVAHRRLTDAAAPAI